MNEIVGPLNEVSLWLLFGLMIGVALAIDLGIYSKIRQFFSKTQNSQSFSYDITKNETEIVPMSFRQALHWTIVWISLAMVFAGFVWWNMGYDKLLEFVTGYTLEESLSVDNMFVFLLIFTTLGIAHKHQHKVLFVGILSAIVLRTLMILGGVTLLESFHWMIFVFGGALIFTAIRMLIQKEKKTIEIEKNLAVRLLRKILPINTTIQTHKFLIRKDGMLYASTLLVALAIVEVTDLVFAFDSIPAVLAITTDPFIVITSNIFAVIGLRSLYFLVGGMLERLHYLKYGLVGLLLFIGTKMILSEVYDVPLVASLIVIFAILSTVIGASFLFPKYKKKHEIDYNKYLNCPDCRAVEFYCPKHKEEIEELKKRL